jgi:hypothetical protein
MKEQLMKFIDWLYEDDYMIIKTHCLPYFGDMNKKELEAIVIRYLKETEE